MASNYEERPILILVKKNQYKRYAGCKVGRTVTNHIISDRDLTIAEVERFRLFPARFVADFQNPVFDSDPRWPGVA